MRIGWVGGLTRSEVYLAGTAAAAGHELEYHNGDVRGHRADRLRKLVDRSALVIILTTINSHQGVQLAKRMARKHGRPAIVMPRCSQVTFRDILAEYDGGNDCRKNQSVVHIWPGGDRVSGVLQMPYREVRLLHRPPFYQKRNSIITLNDNK